MCTFLRRQNCPHHHFIGMAFYPLGRCLQSDVGAMSSDLGSRKTRREVALFAEKVEQFIAKRPSDDQGQADESGAHLASLVTPPNRRYRIGRRISVKAVDETRPPITTIASGRWISEPGPVANKSGTR